MWWLTCVNWKSLHFYLFLPSVTSLSLCLRLLLFSFYAVSYASIIAYDICLLMMSKDVLFFIFSVRFLPMFQMTMDIDNDNLDCMFKPFLPSHILCIVLFIALVFCCCFIFAHCDAFFFFPRWHNSQLYRGFVVPNFN